MRVVVDYDRCESNAVCMGILPEVFEVRDDNFLYVLNEDPSWRRLAPPVPPGPSHSSRTELAGSGDDSLG